VDKGVENYEELEKMRTGACVGFHGQLIKSPGKGQLVEFYKYFIV
jgi:hypothetical protein